MIFCESNYSFIEFVTPKNFEIVHYIPIYHIRNVKKEDINKLIIRMRNYSEIFKIHCES